MDDEFVSHAGPLELFDDIAWDTYCPVSRQIVVRIGVSSVSVEGARQNLKAEIPGWDFDRVAKVSKEKWEKLLSMVLVNKKDTPNQRSAFKCVGEFIFSRRGSHPSQPWRRGTSRLSWL